MSLVILKIIWNKKSIFEYYCGPCISLDAFLLDGETRFLIYSVKIWFLEKTWNCRLFFIFLFKEKRKKEKKNPKCDSLGVDSKPPREFIMWLK